MDRISTPPRNPVRRRKSKPSRPKLPPSLRVDGRIRGPVDAITLWRDLADDERAAFLERMPADVLALEADDLELYAALAYASSRGHRRVVAHGTRIDMPRRFVSDGPPAALIGGGA